VAVEAARVLEAYVKKSSLLNEDFAKEDV